MSVRANSMIFEAACRVGDPAYSRILSDEWRLFMNQRCRKMAGRMRLVKYLATFDIEADNEMYSIPSDSVQITRIQYSPTPSNTRTFRDLGEYMNDEFRGAVDWNYPTGEPTHYCADQGFVRLVPRPTITVVAGGRIEYWGLPEEIVDPSRQDMPFQDMMRDVVIDGMVADGLRKLEKVDQADRAEMTWEAAIDRMRVQMEDRSDDRRTRVRAGSSQRGFSGQV